MEAHFSSSLYPLHRCKTLHLVRHAQGFHNVAGLTDQHAWFSNKYFDSGLTPLGWQQVDNLRKHALRTGLLSRIELVVTSPLLRTMQTAAGVFGGGDISTDASSPPLMLTHSLDSHPSISSVGCPPFLAVELCREHFGVLPCDRRRNISEYRSIFPAIDFSLIETDEDTLWHSDIREKEEEVAARGKAFFEWLWTRKETEIAIISHGGFFRHTLALFGKDCHSSVREEISKDFLNCELRSMVLIDKSAVARTHTPTDST